MTGRRGRADKGAEEGAPNPALGKLNLARARRLRWFSTHARTTPPNLSHTHTHTHPAHAASRTSDLRLTMVGKRERVAGPVCCGRERGHVSG